MQVTHITRLSSTEIASLWTVYISDSLSACLATHLLQHNKTPELQELLKRTLKLTQTHRKFIKDIFEGENFPVPEGFGDKDINLDAPALFNDIFSLSYVYGMSRIGLVTYGNIVSNVARKDIRQFFTQCLQSTNELYNISVDLMVAKGIYDRPPMIPYPNHVEFLKKKETFLSKWLEEKRPLNVVEITEIFYNIERNYFGLILLTGFIQVAKDEEVKRHLLNGKELVLNQIEFLNQLLIKDDLLGTIMVNSEVTDSTTSPFSDKLIMFLICTLNSTGLAYIGHAISTSARVDLTAGYARFIPKILQFGKEGFDIMIERAWLEQTPLAPDRKALAKV
ncbi:MAG: sugar isomerase [Paenibacillaceae bacterium]|nr:sugar isomerase [Paenibacillaceae bacterium]